MAVNPSSKHPASDRAVLWMRSLSVLGVAAIAAVVSYLHIEHLAVIHGQTLVEARLLPLSVDGTVAAASATLLVAARRGNGADPVAYLMLVLGIAATLAANVAAGWGGGPIGAMSSGWPAVAFVGSVEIALRSIRRSAKAAQAATEDVAADGAERPSGRPAVRPPVSAAGAPRRTAPDREAAALAILQARGRANVTGEQLAGMLGVSERTGRRYVAKLGEPAPDTGPIPAVNGSLLVDGLRNGAR